jgi:hypothetical protein
VASQEVKAMSWVTNVMVSVNLDDRNTAAEFAAWLCDRPFDYLKREQWHRDFPYPWPEEREWQGPYSGALAESPAEVWPGTKVRECSVWLGVLNHADLEKVRARFAAMPWQVPNAVQLMLMDQEECFFRLWMIRDGQLYQVPLPGPYEDEDEFWPRHVHERLDRLLRRTD